MPESADALASAEEGPLPASLLMLLLLAVLAICVPCSLCATYLWWKYVLPKLRERLKHAAAAKADKGSDDKDEEDDEEEKEGKEEKEEVSPEEKLTQFLDPAWLTGMDDSPDLEINPVIKYRVDEEKRAALRAAAEAAADGAGGGEAWRGVPGAIARLGWSLDDKANQDKEELKFKENRRQMKNIEGFIARTYEANVSYETSTQSTLAGSNTFNALEMAKRTQIERVGGQQQAALVMVAQKGRAQLAQYMMMNPTGVGKGGSFGDLGDEGGDKERRDSIGLEGL
jgi:hypothetical protein